MIVLTLAVVAGVVTILTGLAESHWWMYRSGYAPEHAKAELDQWVAPLERELEDRPAPDRPVVGASVESRAWCKNDGSDGEDCLDMADPGRQGIGVRDPKEPSDGPGNGQVPRGETAKAATSRVGRLSLLGWSGPHHRLYLSWATF